MSRQLTALVIGNADYENAKKLKNPVNDANDIATKLLASGFAVEKVLDCTYPEMDKALKRFKRSLKDQDVGLFFFAGHGLQIDGENYLTAIDTDASGEDEAKYSSLPLNRVIDVMEKADTQTSIIILDACPCGSARSFQALLPAQRLLLTVSTAITISAERSALASLKESCPSGKGLAC